jgi:magnesium-transporting ATPase (P-type)
MNPFRNPFLFYSMLTAFFTRLSVIYVPVLERVFRTEPLTVVQWGEVGLFARSVVVAV